MMLTQKPTHALRVNPMHRRMPSAPAIQVQPTRTPGLLVLAPPRPQARRKSLVAPAPARRNHHHAVRPLVKDDDSPAFPICDDVSEIGSPRPVAKELPSTPRSTRVRKTAKQHQLAPVQTAPAPATPPPANKRNNDHKRAREMTPSPKKNKPAKRERRHQRTPSDGLFNMSGVSSAEESDPEPTAMSTSSTLSEQLDLGAIFASASAPATPTRPVPIRSASSPAKASPRPRPASTSIIGTSASAPARANFAGSLFQSAPQVDALPSAALL